MFVHDEVVLIGSHDPTLGYTAFNGAGHEFIALS